jgi:cell division septum initiation protein DivIVA
MINTKQKQITALQEENEKLKQDIEELKEYVAKAEEEKAEEQHAEVQEKLIGEFEMSQEEFDARLIQGMESPAVVDYMSRMLQNAMMMGLGR